jgi:uncharacterized protein YecT (DUF1311 family)
LRADARNQLRAISTSRIACGNKDWDDPGFNIAERRNAMRSPIFLTLLVGMAVISPVTAQECDRADESQTGMNICAVADYKAADAKLNKTYGEIVKRLASDADTKKRLQAAQRNWISFRDAECKFATADSKDGSIYPMLVSQCLEGLTSARTQQLGAYLECEEGDMSCPVPSTK